MKPNILDCFASLATTGKDVIARSIVIFFLIFKIVFAIFNLKTFLQDD